MKLRTLFLVLLLPLCLVAQTKIEKSFPLESSQALILDFDYPELIKVNTWDKQEVSIRGMVSINRGENDGAFELVSEIRDHALSIKSLIRDRDRLPKRLLIMHGGTEYYFKTDNYQDAEVQKFFTEKGREYRYMNNGVIIEIELEIFIPKNVKTLINAKYGIVELLSCDAPIHVEATYGGVDVTIPKDKGPSELKAKTKFGEIYTNLTQKPQQANYPDDYKNWTSIHYALGNGNPLHVESKYGKVYLRTAK